MRASVSGKLGTPRRRGCAWRPLFPRPAPFRPRNAAGGRPSRAAVRERAGEARPPVRGAEADHVPPRRPMRSDVPIPGAAPSPGAAEPTDAAGAVGDGGEAEIWDAPCEDAMAWDQADPRSGGAARGGRAMHVPRPREPHGAGEVVRKARPAAGWRALRGRAAARSRPSISAPADRTFDGPGLRPSQLGPSPRSRPRRPRPREPRHRGRTGRRRTARRRASAGSASRTQSVTRTPCARGRGAITGMDAFVGPRPTYRTRKCRARRGRRPLGRGGLGAIGDERHFMRDTVPPRRGDGVPTPAPGPSGAC